MSIVQIFAVALIGSNLVGYFLHWGDRLAQIDKLMWIVIMMLIFCLEAVADMFARVQKEDDDEGNRPY